MVNNLEKIEKKSQHLHRTDHLPTPVDIWTTTYLPRLVNVVCERPVIEMIIDEF